MDYVCSVCKQTVNGDMILYMDHTQKHIIDLLKHDHPEWSEKDGVCQPCVKYYEAELKGSAFGDAPCVLRRRKMKSAWQAITQIFSKTK